MRVVALEEAFNIPELVSRLPPGAIAARGWPSASRRPPGWEWHAETAVHVLRLVLSGTLDRHRRLRLIIGHMGEMLPMMMARFDTVFQHEQTGLERSVDQRPSSTTSSSRPAAFSRNEVGRAFLDRLPVAPDDREKIAHGNADRVLKL